MQKKLWIIFLHFECTIIILANNYLEIIIRNNLGSIKLLIFDSNVICSQLLPRKLLSLLIFYNHFFSLFLSIFLSFNYCNSYSYRSVSLLVAIAINFSLLYAIAINSEKERNFNKKLWTIFLHLECTTTSFFMYPILR